MIGYSVSGVSQIHFVCNALAGLDTLRRVGPKLCIRRKIGLRERRYFERIESNGTDAAPAQRSFEGQYPIAPRCAHQTYRDARFMGRLGGDLSEDQRISVAPRILGALQNQLRRQYEIEPGVAQYVRAVVRKTNRQFLRLPRAKRIGLFAHPGACLRAYMRA